MEIEYDTSCVGINLDEFEKAGMICSGINDDMNLVEIIELTHHKWYIGVQFHPEYSSTVIQPHPLFVSFIKNASQNRN